jgi:flagellar hook-associated protein 2
MASTTSVSGLTSGIQWQDMIDQIMTLEKSRQLDPITNQQSKNELRLAAWASYNDVITKVRDAAQKLQKATPFNSFAATIGSSPTTGVSVASATAGAGAVPATYQIEVQDVSRAEKLGATAVADVTAAMGLTGDVLVGGRKLSVVPTDTLASIRDKINALNSGGTASRVSASILTVSSGVNRLVLTNDVGGSSGIEFVENGGTNVLSSLGLVSASLVANTIGGDARSYGFADSVTALGQSLGTTMPAAGAFKVNGFRVDIDLSQDSLTAIASKINAAAGANTASVATEMVNGRAVSRLIVDGTVAVNTDDGPALEAVSSQNLQQLGFLRNARGPGMQLVAPSDAKVVVDGITIVRSSNTISDALAGVTLNLQQAELGTTVNLTVARDSAAAVTAIKEFATAYNTASAFVATNTNEKGPLAFDTSIRATLRQLRSVMFDPIAGLQNTLYTTGTSVGVALDKAGKIQVDETKLQAALADSPTEVQALFSTSARSTLPTVQFMSGSTKTFAGTYAVDITAAATKPVATSSVLAGMYGNAAVADTMKVVDSYTGKTTTIALIDTDTVSTIASKLNVAFGANGVGASAAVAGGNTLELSGAQYGLLSTLTISFELGATAAAQQLGFNTTAYAGTNVAGTINGQPATGSGRLLTADAPLPGVTNDAEGLSILHTGSIAETASLTYVLGLGGMMFNRAEPMSRLGDGQIQAHQDVIQTSIDKATRRAESVETRLTQMRESLVKRFTAMETALSRLQAQSTALVSQLNSLQSSKD